ncbi:MAG: hypothetical protein H6Q14_578 [Bacteroidetes bacterium]|nr:hypothetical protein [Bacteroidota bacterium]
MKKRALFSIIVILLTAFFISCKDDEDDTNSSSNETINKWIYDNMEQYYLWTDQMPTSPDYSLSPANFFESILYTNEDRFSWIQENYEDLINELNGVESQEIGFEYMFWQDSSGQIYIEVLYPKKGTDATSKGIVRGDFITSVNGQEITTSNYTTILSGSSSYTLNVCKNLGNWELGTPTAITVTPSSNYAEDPVYISKTITTNNGKVGYLVYNFFANDNGDDTYSYSKELADTLNGFISNSVNNIVLDLRYNSGGAITAAQILASSLVKARSTSSVFVSYTYNTNLTTYLNSQYGSSYFKDNFEDTFTPTGSSSVSIPKLGDQLNHIYILTGQYTASASELIINGLKPYSTNITLIGDTTYGKNVGSISIYEEGSTTNTWGMQPIVTKLWNSAGESDYTNGFAPDYYADDYHDENGYPRILKSFGDESENLLSIALKYINGEITSSSSQTKSNVLKQGKARQIARSNRSFDLLIDNKNLSPNLIK